MDFVKATDKLMQRGVTLQEIADAIGVAYTTVRAMRLSPESSSHRNPPDNWRPKLAKLARERGEGLHELAEELEGTPGNPEKGNKSE